MCARLDGLDSPNLRKIKGLWRAYEEQGQQAALEALLELCDEDSELRPYSAEGRVLRGPEEVREHYRQVAAEGTTVQATADHFEEDGDTVTATGSVRVNRGGGAGIVDAQVRWRYVFEGDRLQVAEYGPLSGAPLRDAQESRV